VFVGVSLLARVFEVDVDVERHYSVDVDRCGCHHRSRWKKC